MMTYTTQGLYLQENFRCNTVLYHLPSVDPKQLCALAHLGCTREADKTVNIAERTFIFYRRVVRTSSMVGNH